MATLVHLTDARLSEICTCHPSLRVAPEPHGRANARPWLPFADPFYLRSAYPMAAIACSPQASPAHPVLPLLPPPDRSGKANLPCARSFLGTGQTCLVRPSQPWVPMLAVHMPDVHLHGKDSVARRTASVHLSASHFHSVAVCASCCVAKTKTWLWRRRERTRRLRLRPRSQSSSVGCLLRCLNKVSLVFENGSLMTTTY